MLTLVLLDKQGTPSNRYPIDGSRELVLGRGMDVDIPLLSKNVSRKHAKVFLQNNQFFIQNISEANVILINKVKIKGAALLENKALIQLGDLTFVAELDTKAQAAAVLLGQQGAFEGKTFALSLAETVLGRGSESQLLLADTSISRRHASITVHTQGATLCDLDSANGTFVNERQIKGSVAISFGDIIRLGSVSLLFQSNQAPAPARAVATAKAAPSVPSQPLQPAAVQSLPPKPIGTQSEFLQPAIPNAAAAVHVASTFSTRPKKKAPRLTAQQRLSFAAVVIGALSTLLLLGVVIYRLVESMTTPALSVLQETRAQMPQRLAQLDAAKNAQNWVEAEKILKTLPDPFAPEALAIGQEVRFQARNARLLEEANALYQKGSFAEAAQAAARIEANSSAKPRAELLLASSKRRILATTLRDAATKCQADNTQGCLVSLCVYLDAEPKDESVTRLARLLLGKLPSSPKSCVSDPLSSSAERGRTRVEAAYGQYPLWLQGMLFWYDGKIAEALPALQGALAAESNAFIKIQINKSLKKLESTKASQESFAQQLAAGALESAEASYRIVLSTEQDLFDNQAGTLSLSLAAQLMAAYAKQGSQYSLLDENGRALFQTKLDQLRKVSPESDSIARYQAELLFYAAIRDAVEQQLASETAEAKQRLQALRAYVSPSLTLRQLVDEALSSGAK